MTQLRFVIAFHWLLILAICEIALDIELRTVTLGYLNESATQGIGQSIDGKRTNPPREMHSEN